MECNYIHKYINSIDINLPQDVLDKVNEIKKKIGIYNEPLKTTTLNKDKDKEIFLILNKISNNNYEKMSKQLFEEVKKIKDYDEIYNITNKIFNIASSSSFYSILFSKLYIELIKINGEFYKVFQDNFSSYCSDIKNIKYVDPIQNYDGYCIYIKNITKLESALCFFSTLALSNISTSENMVKLMEDLLLLYDSSDENSIELKQKIINSLYIIIDKCLDIIIFAKEWSDIYDKLQNIKNNTKDKKIKFKIMDINDIINDKQSK